MSRSSSSPLADFDPEPERTFHFRRKLQFKNTSETIIDTTTIPQKHSPSSSQNSSPPQSPPKSPPPKIMPKLSDALRPAAANMPKGSNMPSFTAPNFTVNPGYVTLVKKDQFGGTQSEDPTTHINNFCDICYLIKQEGLTNNQLRLLLFPFSLKGKAKFCMTVSPQNKPPHGT